MAANTQAVSSFFKSNMLNGFHVFGPGGVRSTDVFKAALYFQNSSIGPNTAGYTPTGEVTGTNYTAGGIVVPNATGLQSSGATTYWTPSANLVWTNLTISSPFDCVLIYNATSANDSVASFTFPAQTITNGNFTIAMPVNASTSALIQVN